MVVGGASNLPFNNPSTMAEPTDTRIFSGTSCSVHILALALVVADFAWVNNKGTYSCRNKRI